MRVTTRLAALAGVALSAISAAQAQQAPAPASKGDVVVVTGTRVGDRSVLDTAVAVDVLSAEALEGTLGAAASTGSGDASVSASVSHPATPQASRRVPSSRARERRWWT